MAQEKSVEKRIQLPNQVKISVYTYVAHELAVKEMSTIRVGTKSTACTAASVVIIKKNVPPTSHHEPQHNQSALQKFSGLTNCTIRPELDRVYT